MQRSFKYEPVVYDGKEYLLMKSDVFHSFFLEVMKYTDIDEMEIKQINNIYKNAKSIKRKRIRLKKEKQALILMYNLMFYKLIQKNDFVEHLKAA